MALDISGKLNISDLDFESIKSNLKSFMQSQSEFSGYDFDGSTFDVLFDLLAYNTYYNAFYMNMLASEAFLDTSVLRDSVVSKAKSLGYTTRSVYAPRAKISLAIDTNGERPGNIVLNKYQLFNTLVNNTTYTFATGNSYIIEPDTNFNYVVNDVELIQGYPVTYRYTANTADQNQKFILRNANTDTTTLDVKIKLSDTSTNLYSYQLASDITTTNSISNVYFLQETFGGLYEITFGDGVFGRAIEDGNIVIMTAMITEGNTVNFATDFTLQGNISGYTDVVISTSAKAYGGAARESIDEIKFNAPKFYETQNRLVTANDYKTWLKSQYRDAASVTTWGGERNDPPVYGKVYIAVKPKENLYLTDATRLDIINNYIAPKSIVTVTPELMSPKYTNIIITSEVKYKSSLTTVSGNLLKYKIIQALLTYSSTNLSVFDGAYRGSRVTRLIDNINASIQSNVTTIKLRNDVDVRLGTEINYDIRFHNQLYHPHVDYEGTLTTSYFSYYDNNGQIISTCQLDDNNGIVRVIDMSTGNRVVVKNNIGTIDYATGHITLTSFAPIAIVGDSLSMIVQPLSTDIIPQKEQILLIKESDVTINMVLDYN